jgi:putative glutamine amidotransferase
MTRQPVIGITWGARPFEKFVPYQRAIEREGGRIEKIDARTETDADPLRRVDAILFPGGGDVAPHFYGQSEVHPCVEPEPQLDELELRLARVAVERGLPVLGICRGLQMLNVALGGTLIQDLPTAGFGDMHKRPFHAIDVAPSEFSELVDAQTVQVNSRHHQAISELAPPLKATAHSEDGIIEGIEMNDGLVLAVQSHPEDLVDEEWTRRLFRRFIELARRQN